MSTPPKKVQAVARVQVTVEVSVGCWGDDCSIGQLYRQAEKDAIGQVEQACHLSGHKFRLVGAKVTGVITEEEKR